MNTDNFIKLVQHPESISVNDLEALEEMVRVFPYCGLAHMLISKYHYDQADMLASQKLRKAAAYAVNRETLKKVITGERPRTEWIDATPAYPERLPYSAIEETPSFEETPLFEETPPLGMIPGPEEEVLPVSNAELLPEPGQEEVTEELVIESPLDVLFAPAILPVAMPEPEAEPEEPPLRLGHLNDDEHAIEEFSKRVKKNIQREIIESFIKSEPRISGLNMREKDSYTARDLSETSIKPAGLVSENLANIFVKQGKIDKAIEMFEKLILKYPEKKAYFAQRIEDLKQL